MPDGIVTTPGATVYARLDWGTTGLTGTIAVRIRRDSDSVDVVARTTTGISESPAGSGLYIATLTAPTSAGEYSVVWDDGASFTSEDMLVTYSTAAPGAPSGTDLCTVADVRAYLQKGATETNQDSVIQTFITQASEQIETWCQRQFAPRTATTYTVGVDGYLVDLNPYDLRSVTTMTFDPSGSATVLTSSQYQLRPIGTNNLGTYTQVKLSNTMSLYSQRAVLFGQAEMSILGNWGPSSVPVDVAHAAVVTVGMWMRREVEAKGSYNPDYELESNDLTPRSLPGAALRILEPYRRLVVA